MKAATKATTATVEQITGKGIINKASDGGIIQYERALAGEKHSGFLKN